MYGNKKIEKIKGIELTKSYKYLGIVIDSAVTFKEQINLLKKKTRKIAVTIKAIPSNKISFQIKLMVLQTNLVSVFQNQGIIALFAKNKEQELETSLSSTIKKALRIPINKSNSKLFSILLLPTIKTMAYR